MLDESVITQLVEMGFPMDACRKAVYYTGNSGAEAAMNWVMSHMDDPGTLKAWSSISRISHCFSIQDGNILKPAM